MDVSADVARIHRNTLRLQEAVDLLQESVSGSELTGVAPPEVVALVRQRLAEGRLGLDSARGAGPEVLCPHAAMLAAAECQLGGFDLASVDPERVRYLIGVARGWREAPPDWKDGLVPLEEMLELLVVSLGGPLDGDAGGPSLAQARASADPLLSATALLAEGAFGDERAHRAAMEMLAADREIVAGNIDPTGELWAAFLPLLDRTLERGPAFRAAVQRAVTMLERNPVGLASEVCWPTVECMAELAQIPLRRPAGRAVEEDVVAGIMTAAAAVDVAAAGLDVDALRRHAERITALTARTVPRSLPRLMGAELAGRTELEVARLDTADRAAAGRAITWLTEARAIVDSDHPAWPHLTINYAGACRLAGRLDPATRSAMEITALRTHARQVLLQSGTSHAVTVARSAAKDALVVARRCLADKDLDQAVVALEAGRALVLTAAMASHTVPELLESHGHVALAEEWRRTTGADSPDDLRRRVLRALDAETTHADLIDTALIPRIAAALDRTATAALVYLVPGRPGAAGVAMIVTPRGEVSALSLSELREDAVAGGLDEICRWAWDAAVRQLLAEIHRDTRPGRIVLVPMGAFALVPWHAAFTVTEGQERHYAVHEVAFSYAASARVFCASADREVLPVQDALVIGNPTGNLAFAGREAEAIHQNFYPYGRLLGQDGTRSAVLGWLTAADRRASVLHFACHGHVDPRQPAAARLVLAEGSLTAEDLLELSGRGPLHLGEVFLAACTSSAGGDAYDEAFSMATAFLVAGATAVTGSLWLVPDVGTSLMMYMVHHFRTEEGCAPADALHRAQLWMIDPDRQAPAGMPPKLSRRCRQSQCAAIISWAAFTHQGR
jgi:hypothetical protein